MFSRPRNPGHAGAPLAVGSYNLELFPTTNKNPTKMRNIAENLGSKHLDIALLQEASYQTAYDLISLLRSEGQEDWKIVGSGNNQRVMQQILYRSERFAVSAAGRLGRYDDGNPSTPLATPWARLTRVDREYGQHDIYTFSVHLERPSSASAPRRKSVAHTAARALLDEFDTVNTEELPTVVGGDFQGNFGAWCDERSAPACVGEGQPTFVRRGYWDAQSAVSKIGTRFSTFNGHALSPRPSPSGAGARTDFLLFKGFDGISRYENVVRSFGRAGPSLQSDHNLIVAMTLVP